MDNRKPHADASWYTPYLRALEIAGIPESQRSWFFRWAERFAAFFKEKPLSLAFRDDVESFAATLRSAPGNDEWKTCRASDALRLLLTNVYSKRWEIAGTAPSGCTVYSDLGAFQKSKRPLAARS